MVWYKSIFSASTHSRAKKKIEEFENITADMERINSSIEKETISLFFKSLKGILGICESRELFFEKLSAIKPEISYLCELYSLIGNYVSKCESKNYTDALKELKKIKRILDSWNFKEEVKEEISERATIEIEIKRMIDEIFPVSLRNAISEISKQEEDKYYDCKLFKDSELKLLEKFEPVYKEIQNFGEPPESLVKVSTNQYKKILKTPVTPGFFKDLVNRQKGGNVSCRIKGIRSAKTLYVKTKRDYIPEIKSTIYIKKSFNYV